MPNLTETFDQLKRSIEIQSSECFPIRWTTKFLIKFLHFNAYPYKYCYSVQYNCFSNNYLSLSLCLSVCLSLSLSLSLSISVSLSLSLSRFSWFLNSFRIIQHCNTCSVSLLKMKFGGTKKTGCSTLSWFRIFENSLFMKASTAAKSSVSTLPFPRFQKYLIPEF